MEPEPSLMDPLPIVIDAPLPVEEVDVGLGAGLGVGLGVGLVVGLVVVQSSSPVAPALVVVLPSGQLGWECV